PLSDAVTTTIFISNLHCPSCVSSIQESLTSLDPAPEFLSHSIISHSVVIRQKPSLAATDISEALELAGFEVHSIFQDRSTFDPVEIQNPGEHDSEWQNSLEHAVSRWRHSRG
ncbi:hypothetical protein BCR34DRAFT_469179, partial [Clohesyomyces aquaticus]